MYNLSFFFFQWRWRCVFEWSQQNSLPFPLNVCVCAYLSDAQFAGCNECIYADVKVPQNCAFFFFLKRSKKKKMKPSF